MDDTFSGATATHNIADDRVMVDFGRRLPKEQYDEVIKLFSYWPGRKLFVVKWSPGIEDWLSARGIEIEDDEIVDNTAERVDRFERYAENAEKASDSAWRRAHAAVDGIPMGQPILVGHHSERHHRAALARSDNAMRKSWEESDRAKYWRSRARGAEMRADQKSDPGVIHQRIEGLLADQRRHQKQIGDGKRIAAREHYVGDKEYDFERTQFAETGIEPEDQPIKFDREAATVAFEAAWQRTVRYHVRWIEHLTEVIEYQQALYLESGGVLAVNFEVGGIVKIKGRWMPIVKVNKKTLACETGVMPWPLKYQHSEVQEYRSKADVEAAKQRLAEKDANAPCPGCETIGAEHDQNCKAAALVAQQGVDQNAGTVLLVRCSGGGQND